MIIKVTNIPVSIIPMNNIPVFIDVLAKYDIISLCNLSRSKMLPSQYIEQGWTVKSQAIDKNGLSAVPYANNAIKWSIEGAVEAVKKTYIMGKN